MNTVQRHHGFSLIELLIAVVILSVGLLGLAGMQITGLRGVSNASSYTQATLAVNDLIERIRANPVATGTNTLLVANNVFAGIDMSDCNAVALPAPYCSQDVDGNAAQQCTPAQLASFDINTWFCGEAGPGGTRADGVNTLFPSAKLTIGAYAVTPAIPLPDPVLSCAIGTPCYVSLEWQELNPDRSPGAAATIARNITLTIMP